MATTKKKTTEKKSTKKTTKASPSVKVTIKVNDEEFTLTGKTVAACLNDLVSKDNYPYGAKTKAVFQIEEGKKETTFVLNAQMARRTFMNMKRTSTAVEVLANTLDRQLNA